MEHTYTITIKFDTDRKLTADELDDLETAVVTQVIEPATHEGDDVEYQTWHHVINTTEAPGLWLNNEKEGK